MEDNDDMAGLITQIKTISTFFLIKGYIFDFQLPCIEKTGTERTFFLAQLKTSVLVSAHSREHVHY